MKPRMLLALLCAVLLFAGAAASAAEPLAGCLPGARLALSVRIGAYTGEAILQAGLETPLALLDRATGRLLWTAGAQPSSVQDVPGMDAGFTGSLAVIDLDGDGFHDRLYAGDMAGRLWRFDMQHGAPAASWLEGGVYADFSNDEGRLFVAPPDLSRAQETSGSPLLVALGTAAPGNPRADNRFYVLRDPAPGPEWQPESWTPLREQDLDLLASPWEAATISNRQDSMGWYTRLGTGHVTAPSLTVNRQLFLVVAESIPMTPDRCEVFARLLALPLLPPPGNPALPEPTTLPGLRDPVPLLQGVHFQRGPGAVLQCMAGTVRIEACDVDTRPQRTWWRRDDAP